MIDQARGFLKGHYLRINNNLPDYVLLLLSIEKFKTTPKSYPEYNIIFHAINILICDMPDSDPNKAILIKKLYAPDKKRSTTGPLNNTGPFLFD